MGDKEKIFKNRPKSSPCLKGPTALWRECHYPLISMHLQCKEWKWFWRKNPAPKVPEWPSYGNFGKVTHNPHVLKTCRRKFFQNRSKSSFRLKEPKALWCKWDYPLNSLRLTCKDWKRFGANSSSKSERMAKLLQFSQGHPKPAFSDKVQRGDQGTFFKNRKK